MRKGRRFFAALLVLLSCISIGMQAAATDAEELTKEEKKAKRMLERLYKLPVQSNELTNWPEGPGTYGEAAIVMEAGSGAVLYAKNIDDHHYPASITKVLTTLTALENAQLDDKVSFSEDSLSFLEWGDAAIGMKEGNVISLEQALYAVLLASANEVSYAVGESVGKNAGHDYDWFIEQMNLKCRELGGTNSHFANTNGLHDDNHYTCARDMALIGRELFKYPDVFKIMQTLEYKIKRSKTTERHVFQQNHKMLYMDNMYYWKNVIGGKTGYTDQAHNTLITMTDNGKMQLICVLLKAEGVNVYTDTKNLCDYVYKNFKKVDVAELEKSDEIDRIITDDGTSYVVLPQKVSFEDLEMEITPDEKKKGEAVLTYTYEGNCVGRVRAKLSEAYGKLKIEQETSEKGLSNLSVKEEKKGIKKGNKALAAAIVILIILVFMLAEYLLGQRRKRKRRNRKRK